GDQDVQIKIWKGTVTTGAPDRGSAAHATERHKQTKPISRYDTTNSTPTTKDDALSGDDSYSIKVSQDDDLNNGPTTDTGSFVLDTHAPTVTLTFPPARPKPASTLFPYTTLFRSGDQDVQIKIWKGTVTTGAPDR